MSRAIPIRAVVALTLVASIVGVELSRSGYFRAYASWQECERILAWAKPQLRARGEIDLALPEDLAQVAHAGVVTALRGAEGRTCVLIKRSVGWRHAFTGTLCCDAPLRRGTAHDDVYPSHDHSFDFVHPPEAREMLEMTVDERLSDRWLRVRFEP